MQEKRTHLLPAIRITESLEVVLMRLANIDDRTYSDYVRRILELHAWGHGRSIEDIDEDRNQSRA